MVFSADAEKGLAERLAAAREAFDVPGLAVSVHRAGQGLDVAVGRSSSRGEAAFTPEDRIPISCVMKVLVSVVALLADEQGVLDLKDDLGRYLPDLAGGAGARTGITLQHLLTHTAGYVEPQANSARWGFSWDDFAAFFPGRKQAFEPGAVWSYAHTAFVILQKAIEIAYERPFEAVLCEELLSPLNIELQFYGDLKSGDRDLANLHVKAPRSNAFEPMRPPRETGFLRYSISDAVLSPRQLARLGAFLSGGFRSSHPHLERAVSRLTTRAIDLPRYTLGPEGEKMPVAFCHGIADYGGFKGVNGSYVGSTCALRLDERGFGLATVVNAYAPHLRDLVSDMLGRPFLRDAGEAAEATRPADPSFASDELEGRYEGLMLGAADASIVRDGEGFVCTLNFKRGAPVQGRFALDAQGRPRFLHAGREMVMALARDPASGSPYLMASTSAFRKCA